MADVTPAMQMAARQKYLRRMEYNTRKNKKTASEKRNRKDADREFSAARAKSYEYIARMGPLVIVPDKVALARKLKMLQKKVKSVVERGMKKVRRMSAK